MKDSLYLSKKHIGHYYYFQTLVSSSDFYPRI